MKMKKNYLEKEFFNYFINKLFLFIFSKIHYFKINLKKILFLKYFNINFYFTPIV
jgi:hypothetical protein